MQNKKRKLLIIDDNPFVFDRINAELAYINEAAGGDLEWEIDFRWFQPHFSGDASWRQHLASGISEHDVVLLDLLLDDRQHANINSTEVSKLHELLEGLNILVSLFSLHKPPRVCIFSAYVGLMKVQKALTYVTSLSSTPQAVIGLEWIGSLEKIKDQTASAPNPVLYFEEKGERGIEGLPANLMRFSEVALPKISDNGLLKNALNRLRDIIIREGGEIHVRTDK